MTTEFSNVNTCELEEENDSSSRLTVILTVHNEEDSLLEQLERICEQEYQPWELLVIDDGSSDNSVEIAKKAMEKWSFIKLLVNHANCGIEYSIKRGLEEATGAIVHAASCNDPIYPGFYETGMELLKKYPHAGLFFCDSIVDNKITGCRSATEMHLLDSPGYLSPDALARELRGGVIQTNTVLARKNKLDQMEVYPSALKWNCDLWTFSYMAFKFGACYAPKVMAEHAVETTSYCANAYKAEEQRTVFEQVLKRALLDPDLLKSMKVGKFFDCFMYTIDPVTLPFLFKFLASENFSKASLHLALYILSRKFLHRQTIIYKTYFHTFHIYSRIKKAMIRS